MYIVEIACFILAFLARLFHLRCNPRIRRYFRMGPSGDAYIYHFYTQFLRRYKIGQVDKRCLISSRPSAHPVLFESIWKFLPDYLIISKSWIPGLCSFILGSFIFFFMLAYSELGPELVLLGLALWLLQPDHFCTDYYRIHFIAFQPRYTGAILGSLLFLVLSLDSYDTLTSRMFQCFLILLMWKTSLFSRQVLILVLPLWAILSSDYIIIGQFVLVLAFLFLLDFKGTVAQLSSQFKYYWWYFQNYPTRVRTGFSFRDFTASILVHHVKQLPCYLSLFWIIFLILSRDSSPDFSEYGFHSNNLIATFLAAIIICVVTTLRVFAFAGEGWRYLTFTTLFVSPLTIVIFLREDFFGFETLIIFLAGTLYCFVSNLKNSRLLWQQEDLLRLFKGRGAEFSNAVWYSVPFGWSALLISRALGKRGYVLSLGHQDDDIMKTYFDEYPFLKWDVNMLRKDGVSHICIERCWLSAIEKQGFSLEGCRVMMENDSFIIVKWT